VNTTALYLDLCLTHTYTYTYTYPSYPANAVLARLAAIRVGNEIRSEICGGPLQNEFGRLENGRRPRTTYLSICRPRAGSPAGGQVMRASARSMLRARKSLLLAASRNGVLTMRPDSVPGDSLGTAECICVADANARKPVDNRIGLRSAVNARKPFAKPFAKPSDCPGPSGELTSQRDQLIGEFTQARPEKLTFFFHPQEAP
jgi:hypothetical protein